MNILKRFARSWSKWRAGHDEGFPRHISRTLGDNINWMDEAQARQRPRKIAGWLTPLPEEGETFFWPMASGRTGIYRFTKIEPCNNPVDMFFATAVPVRYADSTDGGI